VSGGRLAVFGEVLFDKFPDGRAVLGGAPFNVAWHLQAFGQAPLFISRIGDDPEGDRVRREMENWGMDMEGLQTDPGLPTGSVSVRFADGEPEYEIAHPAAFDAISSPVGHFKPLPEFRLLYHGSLALREPASREALQQLKAARPGITFVDVNLRAPWWCRDQVLDWLHAADWVKLNRGELEQLALTGGYSAEQAGRLLEGADLKGLLLTHGSEGAELLTSGGEHHRIEPGAEIEVMDTVGAGDAFAAVMILGLARGWDLAVTLRRAQDFASALCGRRGATVRDITFYRPYVDDWELE